MNKTNKKIRILFLLCLIFSASTSSAQDDVRLNKLIDLFENDQPAFGVLSFDYDLANARSMSTSGLDFLFIDMEHAPFDIDRLRIFLLGMTNKRSIQEKGNLQPDVVPFVRIPAPADNPPSVPTVTKRNPWAIRSSTVRALVVIAHGTSWARQEASTVCIASSTSGAAGLAKPIDVLRSEGPIKIAPTPGTLIISSMFATPSADSINIIANNSP